MKVGDLVLCPVDNYQSGSFWWSGKPGIVVGFESGSGHHPVIARVNVNGQGLATFGLMFLEVLSET